ncbi:Uncharacterised protein [Mycobacteroides abscessus subsp. abscessus]|nr:Uncharacterised protein [Mycobacteroides abscessus subsp. abscessus]
MPSSSTVRPGSSSEVRPRFWNDSITWNSGCRAWDRAGLSTSTSRSNGTSACAKAARSRSRTCASRSVNGVAVSTWVRSTRVLTNMPTRSSSACSPRPATGMPMAMSSAPDSRDSSVAKAPCTTMNRVVPLACATRLSLSISSPGTRKRWVPAR